MSRPLLLTTTLLTSTLLTLALSSACTSAQTCDADCAPGTDGTDSSTDASASASASASNTDTGETETGTETATDTDIMDACSGDTPIVVLETSMGTMVVQLDAVRAPITVANFIGYVRDGFYDGTIFHRVIDNFVIQGGGFEPGLVMKPTNGPIVLEIHPELRHLDGAIAMARSQEPDTAESQFYITDGAQPGLDDNYAVFGVMIDGFPVRDAISSVATQTLPWMGSELGGVPIEDVLLNAAYCVEAWP